MRIPACVVLSLAACCSVAAAAGTSPKFTKKPAAVRANGKVKVKISFAADRATDVAVFILDSKGKIVRHLVAGVLGKNAPKPLGPGLAQSIEWDGKADYGKPAKGGPFRVRVALGLGARHDKELISDRQHLGGVSALCAGPDGTLYVFSGFGASVPNWGTHHLLLAFDRSGKYRRTVLPPPADTTAKEWEALGTKAIKADGKLCPMFVSLQSRRLTGINIGRKGAASVTPQGQILVLGTSIGAVTTRGKAVWEKLHGPKLLPKVERLGLNHHGSIAASSDGRYAYLTGLLNTRQRKKVPAFPAVYRVKLPERGPAEPFFGDPASPGKDEKHLACAPRGLAVDGKGHLLVADYANDRVVVVREKDGQFAGAFNVKKPHSLGVDPQTGAVYVVSLDRSANAELVKFSGWKDPRPLARLPVKKHGNPTFPWSMALGAGGKPPVVWMGADGGKLLRIEDQGGKFVAREVSSRKIGNGAFVGIEVDRFREDREIYVRCGRFPKTWFRYNEAADKASKLSVSAGTSCIVPGPGGVLYAPEWPYHLYRHDRNGKASPWAKGGYPDQVSIKGKTTKLKKTANGIYMPVSMTFMTHTLGVRGDGRLFMFDPGYPGGRPPKALVELLPSGERVKKDPIIWCVSDTAVGPKFDPQGNIYIAEQIRPAGEPLPPEFAEIVGPVKAGTRVPEDVKKTVCTIYGSILKFTPKGGMVHWGNKHLVTRFGQPKLDPSLKTVNALYFQQSGSKFRAVKVTGAEWMRLGVSHVDLVYCNCENTRFDVDEFGRVFYPDLGRFRVAVLDTGGNQITHFGGYGNADSAGPGSKHPQPGIAFAWLIGVGVTDKYAYMGDSMNKRLLRAELVYAAEETCTIQ